MTRDKTREQRESERESQSEREFNFNKKTNILTMTRERPGL